LCSLRDGEGLMAAAVPLVGGAIGAYGAIQQGQMTSDSLNQQADSLTQQAAEAEKKGEYDAMRQQIIAGRKIGAAEAAFAASGVSGDSGSAMAVLQASHMNAELDRLNIIHGAHVRAINYRNQATLNRYGAASAIQGSYWRALSMMSMGFVKTDMSGSPGGNKPSKMGEGEIEAEAPEEGYTGADTGEAVAGMA